MNNELKQYVQAYFDGEEVEMCVTDWVGTDEASWVNVTAFEHFDYASSHTFRIKPKVSDEEWSDMKIDQWFYDRQIAQNGNPMTQSIKTLEECHELLEAINKDSQLEMMDAVGDIYVTLRGVCLTAGVEFDDCVQHAYDEIKDRTGYLRQDGMFIKD